MSGRLLRNGPETHECNPSSARGDLRAGAVWECDCGKRWQLVRDGMTDGLYWTRLRRPRWWNSEEPR